MNIFQKPKSLGANVKVELDFSNYATKTVLKNGAGVDTSDFAKMTESANIKFGADKLDTDKLKNIASGWSSLKGTVDKLDIGNSVTNPVDLSKLSNIVKNNLDQNTEHDEIVKKCNAIKTTLLLLVI